MFMASYYRFLRTRGNGAGRKAEHTEEHVDVISGESDGLTLPREILISLFSSVDIASAYSHKVRGRYRAFQ